MAHYKMDYKEFAKYLKNYEERLKKFNKQFVKELANKGLKVARMEYKKAEYAGINDVEVSSKFDSNGAVASATITANGNATLFIEFGTGITKTDSYEERKEISKPISEHGKYGLGHGSYPNGWTYYGGVGQNPPSDTYVKGQNEKGTLIKTKGNNATPAMYDAKKAIKGAYMEAYKKTFGKG